MSKTLEMWCVKTPRGGLMQKYLTANLNKAERGRRREYGEARAGKRDTNYTVVRVKVEEKQ